MMEIKSEAPSVERFELCREVLCKLIARLVLLICDGSAAKATLPPQSSPSSSTVGNGGMSSQGDGGELDEAEQERRFQEELARNLAKERLREQEELLEQKEHLRKISESQLFRTQQTEKQENLLKTFLEDGKLSSPRASPSPDDSSGNSNRSTAKANMAVVSQASILQPQQSFKVGSSVKEKIEKLRAQTTSPEQSTTSSSSPPPAASVSSPRRTGAVSSSSTDEDDEENPPLSPNGRGKGSGKDKPKKKKDKKAAKKNKDKKSKDNIKKKKEGTRDEEWEKELWRREEEQRKKEQELREKELQLKKKQAEIEKKKRELEKEEAKKKREEQWKNKEEELKKRELALRQQEEEELARFVFSSTPSRTI